MRYAVLAYVAWGFFPAYWKLLADLPALEILFHRIIWASLFYTVFLMFKGARPADFLRQPMKVWVYMIFSALFLCGNWFFYIYAVNAGQVIETSLGYFINPLVNVALGVIILRERLTVWRWIALFLAVIGVVILTWQTGTIPWIALALALTFGVYGFIRKIAPVDSVLGGQMEALLMLIPVGAIAFYHSSDLHGLPYSAWDWAWLLAAGPVTGIPLIWFAQAAQLVPLNLLGFVQYISPTIQFLLGVAAYHEPFGKDHFIGYVLIWSALLVFAMDLWLQSRVTALQKVSE